MGRVGACGDNAAYTITTNGCYTLTDVLVDMTTDTFTPWSRTSSISDSDHEVTNAFVAA